MPLNYQQRIYDEWYRFTKSKEKINHLRFLDDIRIFAKNENELKSLIQTIRIFSQDVGMEFGIGKMRHPLNEERKNEK